MATIQRLTLYGFFDSLENDLVGLIRQYSDESGTTNLLSPEQRNKSQKVLAKRGRDEVYNLNDDLDLLYGLDIGEKYSILLKSKGEMDQATSAYFRGLNTNFSKAISIRNDVMHGRPLTAEDHSFTYSLVNELLASANRWRHLAKFHRDVTSNPSSVIAKNYEIFDAEVIEETLHNLPIADYDDTGFVRRLGLEKELKQKIRGRHPVVTVLGDGGNGKSALALQTAYNLAHSHDHEFDAIAWVTAKSSVLTSGEIGRIKGAITSSLEIFSAVADDFSEKGEDPYDRIISLLTDNTVLLFIDNLETVLDDRLKEFAENLPGKSKLVFTSRVPLGSDLTVTVTPFTDSESITLFRRLVEAYSINQFKNASDQKIQKITKKLGNKPLLIKWFIRGIESGLTTQSILAKKDIAVQFCLENVFDKLTGSGVQVARVYAVIPGRLSPNVVQLLSGLSALEVEAALAELSRYAIISNNGSKAYENTYEMSDFARRFLNFTKDAEADRAIRKEHQRLLGAMQNARAQSRYHKYNMGSYTVRSNQEAISKGELQRAYRLLKKGDEKAALEIIDNQKVLNGQYFEVHRTSAVIHSEIDQITKAQEDYEEAIELAPDQPQLRFWFAGFLMRVMSDNDGAASQYNIALELDTTDFRVFNDAIRNQFYISDFEQAKTLIAQAEQIELTERLDKSLLLDLKCQLILRKADHEISSGGSFSKYLKDLNSLLDLLDDDQKGYVDERLLRAIRKVDFHFKREERQASADDIRQVELFKEWLRGFG
jgi:LuxR family glucitol operon transcriptional activator